MASKVNSTSMVAVGAVDEASLGFRVLRFGAKAEERRAEIFSAGQVTVIESRNSLHLY